MKKPKLTSDAALIHAHNYKLLFMGETIPEFTINSTIENLKETIEGENDEFNTMYPVFTTKTNNEGNCMAQISFTYACNVEQKHSYLYIDAPGRCEISLSDSKMFIKGG